MAGESIGRLGTIDSAKWLIEDIFRPVRNAEFALGVIGGVVVGRLAWTLGKSIFRGARLFMWNQHFASKPKLPLKYGTWAMVTGVEMGGISLEFARYLAASGMNVVLIGSETYFLQETARGLENAYRVQVKCYQINHKNMQDAIIESTVFNGRTASEIKRLRVGILVTNSGNMLLPPLSDSIHNTSMNELWRDIQMGVVADVLWSRLVVNDMIHLGRGAIINIVPNLEPGVRVSSQVEAQLEYRKKFSEILYANHNGKRLNVLTLTPYAIDYRHQHFGQRYCNQNFFAPTPYLYVKSSMKLIGVTDESTGYWAHGLQHVICKFIPSEWWSPTKQYLATLFWRQGRQIHPSPSFSFYH